MKRLLIVAFSLISAAPVYAQGEQPNIPKLKADAQKVVSIISGDKAKPIAKSATSMGRSARLMRSKTTRKLRHCPGR
jgi:hypothetical protein